MIPTKPQEATNALPTETSKTTSSTGLSLPPTHSCPPCKPGSERETNAERANETTKTPSCSFRARSQTPYEYLGVLRRALPGRQEEVSAITEAYVAAHYGQVPDTRDELDHLRACWQRIRAEGIQER